MYVMVGAKAVLPDTVSACTITPLADTGYSVEVVSVTGETFTLTVE
jgi:hypothetical protein